MPPVRIEVCAEAEDLGEPAEPEDKVRDDTRSLNKSLTQLKMNYYTTRWECD